LTLLNSYVLLAFLIKRSKAMTRYYVNDNAQRNGDHEVHALGCKWLPKKENREYLGDFNSCFLAVGEARKKYNQVNGCYHCSNECHTG
jgi:hypothetical protein